MASILSAIKAQMLADLKVTATTTLQAAFDGPHGLPVTRYPWAEITWKSAPQIDYTFTTIDRVRDVQIDIHAKDAESAVLAGESIIDLWDGATARATLQALGVIMLVCNDEVIQPMFEDINAEFIVTLDFSVTYRQT